VQDAATQNKQVQMLKVQLDFQREVINTLRSRNSESNPDYEKKITAMQQAWKKNEQEWRY
jgi:hypothetical protein